MVWNLIGKIGERYNRLVIMERAENNKWGCARWLCECDCGTQVIVRGVDLKNGEVKSCGCLKRENFIDETGNRYGRWAVVSRAESDRGQARWNCRCDCGTMRVVRGPTLRNGMSKSCDCLKREALSLRTTGKPSGRTLPEGEAAFNSLLSSMKKGARKRKIKWGLTREEVRILTKQDCHYCGVEPSQVSHNPGGNGDYIYTGIDRVDNDRRYESGNVVPCCGDCNFAKRKKTVEQFKVWGHRFYDHFLREGDLDETAFSHLD